MYLESSTSQRGGKNYNLVFKGSDRTNTMGYDVKPNDALRVKLPFRNPYLYNDEVQGNNQKYPYLYKWVSYVADINRVLIINLELTGSLLLLSKVVWIRLDDEQVRFTVIPERGSQVWAVLSIDSIFEDYFVQSNTPGNAINLQVSLTHLNRALRSAISAVSASIRLTKKDGIPILALTITTTTFASLRRPPALEDTNDRRLPSGTPDTASASQLDRGNDDSISFHNQPPAHSPSDRETTITQSVAITVLAPQAVAAIHEPTCREPDVHILLPPLFQLKAISERFTKLALPTSSAANVENQNTRLILSASPYGEFRIGVQTAACKIESKWQGLSNPELDPTQIQGGEEGVREHASTRQRNRRRNEAWATVRVEGRDWGRVLGVGRLGGRVVACFCDDHALILYVYLENDESGADDSVLTRLGEETEGMLRKALPAHETDREFHSMRSSNT
ncbi:MAG: hypothetical protein Q9213_001396 [Squamulea squamosa]